MMGGRSKEGREENSNDRCCRCSNHVDIVSAGKVEITNSTRVDYKGLILCYDCFLKMATVELCFTKIMADENK